MGRTISTPVIRHHCDPGVTYSPVPEHDPMRELLGPGARFVHPPVAWDWPHGTVVECSCGLRHIARHSPYINEPGVVVFHPEPFARIRRWWRWR